MLLRQCFMPMSANDDEERNREVESRHNTVRRLNHWMVPDRCAVRRCRELVPSRDEGICSRCGVGE